MTPRLIVLTLISIVDCAKSRRGGGCVHLQPNELWIINDLPDQTQFTSAAPVSNEYIQGQQSRVRFHMYMYVYHTVHAQNVDQALPQIHSYRLMPETRQRLCCPLLCETACRWETYSCSYERKPWTIYLALGHVHNIVKLSWLCTILLGYRAVDV